MTVSSVASTHTAESTGVDPITPELRCGSGARVGIRHPPGRREVGSGDTPERLRQDSDEFRQLAETPTRSARRHGRARSPRTSRTIPAKPGARGRPRRAGRGPRPRWRGPRRRARRDRRERDDRHPTRRRSRAPTTRPRLRRPPPTRPRPDDAARPHADRRPAPTPSRRRSSGAPDATPPPTTPPLDLPAPRCARRPTSRHTRAAPAAPINGPAEQRVRRHRPGRRPIERARPTQSSTPDGAATVAVATADAHAPTVSAGVDDGNTAAATVTPPPPAEQLVSVLTPLRTTQNGTYTLHLELKPPELGRVEMRVEMRDGVLHASIHAEHESSAQLLRDALGDLRDRLGAEGVHPGELTVSDGAVGSGQRDGREAAPAIASHRLRGQHDRRGRLVRARPSSSADSTRKRRRCSTCACDHAGATDDRHSPHHADEFTSTTTARRGRHQPAQPGHVPEAARRADEVPGPARADRQHAVPHPDRAVHDGEHAAADREGPAGDPAHQPAARGERHGRARRDLLDHRHRAHDRDRHDRGVASAATWRRTRRSART